MKTKSKIPEADLKDAILELSELRKVTAQKAKLLEAAEHEYEIAKQCEAVCRDKVIETWKPLQSVFPDHYILPDGQLAIIQRGSVTFWDTKKL